MTCSRNSYSVRSYDLIFSKPFSWLVLLLCKHGESSIIIEYKPCRTVWGCCLVRSWCVKRCLHMRHTSSICRIIQKHLSQIACISLGKHVFKWIYQYICLSISFWTPHLQLKGQRPFFRKSFPTDWLAGFSNNPRIYCCIPFQWINLINLQVAWHLSHPSHSTIAQYHIDSCMRLGDVQGRTHIPKDLNFSCTICAMLENWKLHMFNRSLQINVPI